MTALMRQDRPDPASADLQWRLVDRFLTASIRRGDPILLRRARLMVVSAILILPLVVGFIVRDYLLFPPALALRRTLLSIAFTAVQLAIIGSLRFQPSVRIAGNLAAATPLAGLLLNYLRQTSVPDEAWQWAVATPVMAIAFAGRIAGLAWGAAALSMVIALELDGAPHRRWSYPSTCAWPAHCWC